MVPTRPLGRGPRHPVSTSLTKTFHDCRIEMRRHRAVICADATEQTTCFVIDFMSFFCPRGGSTPSGLTIKYAGVFRVYAAIIPKSLLIRARRGRFFGRFNLRVKASVAG